MIAGGEECGVRWGFYFKIWHFWMLMWMTQQREENWRCRGERKQLLKECCWVGQSSEIYRTSGGLGLSSEAESLSRATGGMEESKGTQSNMSVEVVEIFFSCFCFLSEKESRLIMWEQRWGGSVGLRREKKVSASHLREQASEWATEI